MEDAKSFLWATASVALGFVVGYAIHNQIEKMRTSA